MDTRTDQYSDGNRIQYTKYNTDGDTAAHHSTDLNCVQHTNTDAIPYRHGNGGSCTDGDAHPTHTGCCRHRHRNRPAVLRHTDGQRTYRHADQHDHQATTAHTGRNTDIRYRTTLNTCTTHSGGFGHLHTTAECPTLDRLGNVYTVARANSDYCRACAAHYRQ